MKLRTCLLLLAAIAVVFLTSNIGETSSLHVDMEQSTDNTLRIGTIVTTILLDDGFEGDPWDTNWDDNGTTGWIRSNSKKHGGHYAAECNKDNNGYLTSDDLNASEVASITVSFWFRPCDMEAGDMLIRLYNGSTYNTWCDITDYPTYKNNNWCQFHEEITDPQYFVSSFRLRFDGSGLVDTKETFHLDDVQITTEKWS